MLDVGRRREGVLVEGRAAHRRDVERHPVGPALLVEREADPERPLVGAEGGQLGGQTERLLEPSRDAANSFRSKPR